MPLPPLYVHAVFGGLEDRKGCLTFFLVRPFTYDAMKAEDKAVHIPCVLCFSGCPPKVRQYVSRMGNQKLPEKGEV